MEDNEVVEAKLANGTIIHIQGTKIGGEADVAFDIPQFQQVADAIEGIADAVMTPLRKVKPRKASVEFGVEVALEAGKLTALLVKGTGTANLKITMEWGE